MFSKSVFLILFASSAAFATGRNQNLAWRDFVNACLNPPTYNNQIAQTNIVITCESEEMTWMPADGRVAQLPAQRWIRSEVSSNKYTVLPSLFEVTNHPQYDVVCSKYQKIKKSYRREATVTCDDVIKFGKELQTVCYDMTNEDMSSNPSLINTTPTGEFKDLCDQGTPVQQNPGQGPKDSAPVKPRR